MGIMLISRRHIMKLELVMISLTVLTCDTALSAEEVDEVKEPAVNPWWQWQRHGDMYSDHDITRRSVNSDASHTDALDAPDVDATRGDDIYTGHATSSGNQRRHQHPSNRRQRQQEQRGASTAVQQERRTSSTTSRSDDDEDDTYEEDSDVAGVSMLSDESQWPENCTYCAGRQVSRDFRLDQIRRDILDKLRLDSPPNITDKRLPQYPEISEWLKKFPETPSDDDSKEPMVKIISMINIAQPPPTEKTIAGMTYVCFFEFQSDVEAPNIVSAKVGVFVRKVSIPSDTVTMFLLYKVKRRQRGNILLKRKKIRLNNTDTDKWYKFDVVNQVKGWVRNPSSNYGLQIMIFDDFGHSLAIVNPENEEEELYKPYIELTLKMHPKFNIRSKRMTGLNCDDEQSPTKVCCRYPMVVDFSSIGWDWILAPKTLNAYYCSGECINKFLFKSHGHIMEQSQITQQTACCVPNKYNPLKMIYYSNRERIQFGVVNGIIVDTCGCS